MGIPSYFSYIIKHHRIVKQIDKSKKYHNLYLDSNSIIYDVIHDIDFNIVKETDFKRICNYIIEKIENYIFTINPTNTILIAFDGVAPFAKLNQQKQRRYKSDYQRSVLNKISKKTLNCWNTAAITPGTAFMDTLNKNIYKHFSTNKYPARNVVVYGSDVVGEGEHKIFNYIRQNRSHIEESTVVYGLDADLIMLCINHIPICKSLFLFRETPAFIKSIDSDLEPNAHYLLNIPLLAENILLNMNNDKPHLSDIIKNNRLSDYIFICFFLGNDFLPHFPAFNIRTGGMDKVLQAYKATIGENETIIFEGKIIWKNLRKLVNYMADCESLFLKEEINKRSRFRIRVDNSEENLFKRFELVPSIDREIENSIDPSKCNWQKDYYNALFRGDINEQRKKQICVNYLEGLEWCFHYYHSTCIDWRWGYNYAYPPLMEDLIKHIPFFEKSLLQTQKQNPVHELVQLSYVLPKSSLNLLPTDIKSMLLSEYAYWFNDRHPILWAFCKYFWESHVEFPYINFTELENSVLKLTN